MTTTNQTNTAEEMPAGNSLVNVDLNLTKPVTVLIERISNGIGILYEPTRIYRQAVAESKATKIKAETSIEVSNLEQRALSRFVQEEGRRQQNIETIITQALPHIEETARPDNISDDWLSAFFDKCRLVSDMEMQKLWSALLAGEANSPGKFSKRTIASVATLEKKDALLFSNLCNFVWITKEGPLVLIYNHLDNIYGARDINFSSLSHMESIGLIKFESLRGYQINPAPSHKINISYFGEELTLEFPPINNFHISIGQVNLTAVGEELSSICKATPYDDYFKSVLRKWNQDSITIFDKEGNLLKTTT